MVGIRLKDINGITLMQSFLVGFVVAVAVAFLVRRALRKKKCGGGCNCGGMGKERKE